MSRLGQPGRPRGTICGTRGAGGCSQIAGVCRRARASPRPGTFAFVAAAPRCARAGGSDTAAVHGRVPGSRVWDGLT